MKNLVNVLLQIILLVFFCSYASWRQERFVERVVVVNLEKGFYEVNLHDTKTGEIYIP